MFEELKKEYNDMIINKLKINSKVVFGEGNINALIMLIGEAPGGEEELQGRPFVGSAGKNLNEFLKVLHIERENVYITNIVKFRPYKISKKTGNKINRTPNEKEISNSLFILKKEIEFINPKIIVTLGNVPLKAVLNDKNLKIGDVHGKLVKKEQISVFPLYHPASVIYNRKLYDIYNEDLIKLKNYI